MQELAEELRDRGHGVTVATCYPQYNLSNDALDRQYVEDGVESGIRIHRIRTLPQHKVQFIVRGLVNSVCHISSGLKSSPVLKAASMQ